MLSYVASIVARRILYELMPIGINHADHPIVKIDAIVLIHGPHIIGAMCVDVAQDQINILFVAKHNIIEKLEAELRELNRPASHLFNLFALLALRRLAQDARLQEA